MTAARREGLVVLGAPRSGTTLLRRLLDAHPDIACPPESYVLRAAARFLASERSGVGVDMGPLAGLAHRGHAEAEVVRGLADFVCGLLAKDALRAGKRRWAEKTAFDAFHADGIVRLLGSRVHYVCLVRHGLDLAASLEEFCARTGSYVEEIHAYVRRDAVPLRAFARLWEETTRRLAAIARERAGDALLVRYEDLVAAPEETLARILAFAGEDCPPDLVATALAARPAPGPGDWKAQAKTTIDAEAIGRWKRIPAPLRAEMARIANPLLAELGYETVPDDAPPEGEEARRRYEMAMRLAALRKPGA